MSIINHMTYGPDDRLEDIIIKEDGTPLHGEIQMFRRIYTDCDASPYNWHFWHNLRFPINVNAQSEIQIDFLLVCNKGVIIVEVKGGRIGINNGIYYYEGNGIQTPMQRTPFDQASDYKHALINHRIINSHQLFITTACAFPHTEMESTNPNPSLDCHYKLWSKIDQDDNDASFAYFCIDVIEEDKYRSNGGRGWSIDDLSDDEVNIAIRYLTNNFRDRRTIAYDEIELETIIRRLNVDNLNALKSLRKNDRIYIEGGPGTGKTTIAKAYIEKYSKLKGIYLCWNKLLEAKIRRELLMNNINGCEVKQFASLVLAIQNRVGDFGITIDNIADGTAIDLIKKMLEEYRKTDAFYPFDYVVVDEAQDIIDKGVIDLLQYTTSIIQNGMNNGKYLILYDTEQGYNSHSRQICETILDISKNGAHYILDENKRVPTNNGIVALANQLVEENLSAGELYGRIQERNYEYIQVSRNMTVDGVINYINGVIEKIEENNWDWNDYVILGISSLQYMETDFDETVYERIATLRKVKVLSEENICNRTDELAFTTIRPYKGLESNHIILIVDSCNTAQKLEELYIGMTRAIIDLKILVVNA